mgnify:CR=1 FL=1
MNDSILELAKKLKALADRGEGGEKDNAAELLDKLCKKHNIDMADLDDKTMKERTFLVDYNDTARQFFIQVLCHVIGRERVRDGLLGWKRKNEKDKTKKSYFIQTTDLEYLEISAKYDFYYRKYQEDLAIFYSAFIQKNRLGVSSNEKKELTPEEREELQKIFKMMEGLNKHTMVRQIENAKP